MWCQNQRQFTVQLTGNVTGTRTTRHASTRETREGTWSPQGIASKTKTTRELNYSQFTCETSLKGPGTIMIQAVHKIHVIEHSDMQLQHICTLYWTWLLWASSQRSSHLYSRVSWRSKYKQHCWVEYDSTGGVRQLTKSPTCSYCAHGLLRENNLNNTNINNNNNNNRIFSLNILHVIVSAWPLGAELEA